MAKFDGQGIGNKLMMRALEDRLVVVLFLVLNQATAIPRIKAGAVDLVKREPKVHKVTQAFEKRLAISQVKIDHLAAFPSAVGGDQVNRRRIMQNGCKNLHAAAVAFGKKIFVIAQPFLVGFGIVAVGKNTRPAN